MCQTSPRIVLDTNVLVAAAYAPRSASGRIIDACLHGDLVAVASRATIREHEAILSRAVRGPARGDWLERFFDQCELVEPARTPRHVPDDAEDDKFLAVALAGQAGWIITNDHHLLDLDPYWQVRIVRPGVFARSMELK
jgi:putative PIN family toxin of toxin-antitoxin system